MRDIKKKLKINQQQQLDKFKENLLILVIQLILQMIKMLKEKEQFMIKLNLILK